MAVTCGLRAFDAPQAATWTSQSQVKWNRPWVVGPLRGVVVVVDVVVVVVVLVVVAVVVFFLFF